MFQFPSLVSRILVHMECKVILLFQVRAVTDIQPTRKQVVAPTSISYSCFDSLLLRTDNRSTSLVIFDTSTRTGYKGDRSPGCWMIWLAPKWSFKSLNWMAGALICTGTFSADDADCIRSVLDVDIRPGCRHAMWWSHITTGSGTPSFWRVESKGCSHSCSRRQYT